MSGIEEDRASGFEVMQLELELLQTWLLNSGLGLSVLVSGLPWLEASKRDIRKKKIRQTKTKVALLPSRENEKMDKQIENEERGGIAFSSSSFRGQPLPPSS